MTKEQLVYDLAKEIFLRKLPVEYLSDKSDTYHNTVMDNAIKVAKKFYERVELDEQDNNRR